MKASFARVLAFAGLILVGPLGAHTLGAEEHALRVRDPLELAPTAAATDALLERVTGEVRHVRIDDLVAGTVIDHYAIKVDGGETTVLKNVDASNLASGDVVEVEGRRNGARLFATTVHVRQRASRVASADQKSFAARISGTLALLHADDFDNGRSSFVFEVLQDAGTPKRLDFPGLPEALSPGMQVTVTGVEAADGAGIVPQVVTIHSLPGQRPAKEFLKATKTNNVLLILMTFTDSGSTPFVQSQVQAVVAGGTGSGSVSEYFKEVSFGQQLLNVTVSPWLATGAATPTGCDWQTMGSLGRSAATRAGYSIGNYQNLVYVFPQVGACSWIGLGYIGAGGVWINGRNTTQAYSHELGHNLGLLHAGSLRCTGASIGGTCSVSEYGDPFDVMGNQSTMHLNAAQKSDLGWIAPATVVTHSAGNATYALSPIESAGGSTYAVRIPAASNRTYWLEYRQPIGFDSGLVNYPNNGVQVRVASPFETMCASCDLWSNDTQFVDMTPGTSSFTDGALVVGSSFTDPSYGVRISVLSSTSSALTVQVASPGGVSTTTTSLSASANPAVTGMTITLSAAVAGNNPGGTVKFMDSGVALSGCTAVALSGTGNSRTAACTTSALSTGAHSITATYGGDASNATSTSPSLLLSVNALTLDAYDHFYSTILGRAADPSGKAFWQSEVTRMQSLGVDVLEAYMAMAGVFFTSAEYVALATSDTRYIADLYATFVNRAPDAGGFAYWSGQLSSGLPRDILMYSFMFSPEGVSYLNTLVPATPSRAEVYVVVDFYRGLLNRLPDSSGFNFWLSTFRGAQCAGTGAQAAIYAAVDSVSSGFVGSAEYGSRNRTDRQFVSDLYYAFLRRGGDLAGFNYWVGQVQSGAQTRDQLRRAFLSSPEFAARVQAIIAQGCLR